MAKRTFIRETEYLHIPIHDDIPDNFYYVKVYDGDACVQEFHMGIAIDESGEEMNFYVAMFLGNYRSNEITLVCEDGVPDSFFDGIIPGKKPEEEPGLYPDLYREDIRQQIHFSPCVGWMNDPNGLFWKDGNFHLYFQHNPFGSHHGGVNVSWGHAVSADGVHFKEYPDAIMPYSSRCHVASGSAVVDAENFSGEGAGTVIAAYTALQSRQYRGRKAVTQNEGQMLLYSRDDGKTYQYFEKNPIIPVPDGEEWRDPKIFVYENQFCVIVYERIDGEDCASFYVSSDCRTWVLKSRSKDLYECPDIFPLKVSETGEELWVLYGGSGRYAIGTFSDFVFTAIEKNQFLDYGENVYAGQTFNHYPSDEFRYHIAWMVDHGQRCRFTEHSVLNGKSISQAMSLICKLELHKTEHGYRLFRTPIETVETLRKNCFVVCICSGSKMTAPAEYQFFLKGKEPVSITLNGQGFTYQPQDRTIASTSGKSYRLSTEGVPEVRMFTDKRSIEFFIAGEISLSFFVPESEQFLRMEGRDSVVAKRYELSSIWEEK